MEETIGSLLELKAKRGEWQQPKQNERVMVRPARLERSTPDGRRVVFLTLTAPFGAGGRGEVIVGQEGSPHASPGVADSIVAKGLADPEGQFLHIDSQGNAATRTSRVKAGRL